MLCSIIEVALVGSPIKVLFTALAMELAVDFDTVLLSSLAC